MPGLYHPLEMLGRTRRSEVSRSSGRSVAVGADRLLFQIAVVAEGLLAVEVGQGESTGVLQELHAEFVR